ncbi:peptidase domain-containing ABC transporter [Emticicia sp. SJ17W-69]|uniref:peptidase domain-containing ABC transporter n=1 Tax=Emticicia sp. SJ17W-69 TaxID=3421657 RepID=UPI003EBD525C
MAEKTNPIKRLWDLIYIEKKEITSIYFYAILSGLVQLSVPIGVQAIIGFVLGASMVTSIYVLIFVVVLGVLMVGIMQMNQMKIIEKIQQNIFTRYAFEFAETIPRFDLKKVDNYYLPEKVNRFFDTLNVQKGISKLLLDIPIASIQIIFGLVLLSLYHPIFIVFGLLLLFILWFILSFTSKKGWSTSLEESAYKYEVVAWLEEIARVIKSFKFSQGTHLNLQKTDKNVLGYLKARTAHFNVLLVQYRTLVFFKVAITTTMLTVGTYLLLSQQLNIGEFIAAEIVILSVIAAVEKLIGSLDSVYDVITGLEKLASVTETPLEKEGTLPLNTLNNGVSIKISDFNFQYLDGKKALTNINLTIPANSKVCISGHEGSGKSSLLRVISGNFSDFSGSILINNIPIGNYQLETLRNKIGIYLNQQDIFRGTVWENISLNRYKIVPENVTKIAENLGIQSYLDTLQQGFETQIDSAGKKLPSTIVKKILLLRAFANEPNLLLLEEPWQGLEETEKEKMINHLLNMVPNTTIIVVSNDEAFAQKCDYHFHLENGKIV